MKIRYFKCFEVIVWTLTVFTLTTDPRTVICSSDHFWNSFSRWVLELSGQKRSAAHEPGKCLEIMLYRYLADVWYDRHLSYYPGCIFNNQYYLPALNSIRFNDCGCYAVTPCDSKSDDVLTLAVKLFVHEINYKIICNGSLVVNY